MPETYPTDRTDSSAYNKHPRNSRTPSDKTDYGLYTS